MNRKSRFSPAKSAERTLVAQLRKVARTAAAIIDSYVDDAEIINQAQLTKALDGYATALEPWANRLIDRTLKLLSRSNFRAFSAVSTAIGRQLKRISESTVVGATMRKLHQSQVILIKSIPLEAGIRAQDLARSAQLGGRRAPDVAAELLKTESITQARATLIARTEIAKSNAALTQARAEFVGATHYIWRTVGDADVRDVHAELDGEIFRFDDPPEIDGEGAHGPGEIWNCRCYAEPIFSEVENA